MWWVVPAREDESWSGLRDGEGAVPVRAVKVCG